MELQTLYSQIGFSISLDKNAAVFTQFLNLQQCSWPICRQWSILQAIRDGHQTLVWPAPRYASFHHCVRWVGFIHSGTPVHAVWPLTGITMSVYLGACTFCQWTRLGTVAAIQSPSRTEGTRAAPTGQGPDKQEGSQSMQRKTGNHISKRTADSKEQVTMVQKW